MAHCAKESALHYRCVESTLYEIFDTKRISGALMRDFYCVAYRQNSSGSNYSDISKGASFHSISKHRRRVFRLMITVAKRHPKVVMKFVLVGIGSEVSYAEIQRPFFVLSCPIVSLRCEL